MANEVEKIDFGNGEVFEIPKPNNAEIIIKQGGVEKGRFTVNASEPVEIDLDSGGYTKPIPNTDLEEDTQSILSAFSLEDGVEGTKFVKFATENYANRLEIQPSGFGVNNTRGGAYTTYGTYEISRTQMGHDYSLEFPNASGTIALTSDIRGKLDKTGGNMTGNIGYQGSKATYDMIRFIDNKSDVWGNGISIGGGGLTIIGGGESSDVIAAQHSSGGDENMVIANDGAIDFFSNCQNGYSSAKHMTMNTDGTLTLAASGEVAAGNKKAVSGEAVKAAIPTSLPANGGTANAVSNRIIQNTDATKVVITYNLGSPSGRVYFFVKLIGQGSETIFVTLVITNTFTLNGWRATTINGSYSVTGVTVSKSGTNIVITITTNSGSFWGHALVDVF